MACLLVLAIVWLFQGARSSFEPKFDARALMAVVTISAMITVLAAACVTRLRALRIVGAILGLLLALREYVMLSEAGRPFREAIGEPGTWIGLALLTLFVVASAIAIATQPPGATSRAIRSG